MQDVGFKITCCKCGSETYAQQNTRDITFSNENIKVFADGFYNFAHIVCDNCGNRVVELEE